MVKPLFDICPRCGKELVVFDGLYGYVDTGMKRGEDLMCTSCRLIFGGVCRPKSDIRVLGIRVGMVWPKNKCRHCGYGIEDSGSIYVVCLNCDGSNYTDEFLISITLSLEYIENLLLKKVIWDAKMDEIVYRGIVLG